MARVVATLLLAALAFTAVAAQSARECPPGWGSTGRVTRFAEGPCLGISGIGTIETPQKTVYVVDRSDLQNTVMTGPDGHLAYAEEVDLRTGRQRGILVRTNTFCSTGQFLPNGEFISVGGDNPGGGGFSLRAIRSGGQFEVKERMVSFRWYPSTVLLADGRILIVGGSKQGVDMNQGRINNPTLEYYPKRGGEGEYGVAFLSQTLPYNLYPAVHLLPSGRVFIFASNGYILWDTGRNRQVGGVTGLTTGAYHSYPLTGTSFMFPLNSGSGWTAEIMICGGQRGAAKPRAGRAGDVGVTAHDSCHRIQPEVAGSRWITHKMSAPRVMPNSVLLPDGTALILNGAQSGYAGIPNFVRRPVLTPDHFDCKRKRWAGIPLAASKVPRLYHSSAILLHDATVFISGGNPNSGIVRSAGEGATQFRSEFFYPPYLNGRAFPDIQRAPGRIGTGGEFEVTVAGPRGAKNFAVTLAYPGFSTHSLNHGMRNVELDVVKVTGAGPYTLTVKSPPNKNVAPPHWYWLFVLIDGVPNRDGHSLNVI